MTACFELSPSSVWIGAELAANSFATWYRYPAGQFFLLLLLLVDSSHANIYQHASYWFSYLKLSGRIWPDPAQLESVKISFADLLQEKASSLLKLAKPMYHQALSPKMGKLLVICCLSAGSSGYSLLLCCNCHCNNDMPECHAGIHGSS